MTAPEILEGIVSVIALLSVAWGVGLAFGYGYHTARRIVLGKPVSTHVHTPHATNLHFGPGSEINKL